MKEHIKTNLLKWGNEVTNALVLGIIILALSLLIFGNKPMSIFLAAFTAYMFIGERITELSKNINFVFDFCSINAIISVIMIIGSFIGFIFFSSVLVLNWPLLITGIILLIAAVMGTLGAGMVSYYDE